MDKERLEQCCVYATDAKGAGEATQAATFLVSMQDLLTAGFGIGIGGRMLTAATPTGVTAILLLPVGGMPITLPSPRFHSVDNEG